MFPSEGRELLGVQLVLAAGTFTSNLSGGVVIGKVTVPFACTLKSVKGSYAIESGTTPSLSCAVSSASQGALATLALASNATEVKSSDIDKYIPAGDTITVTATAAAADNDFEGVLITAHVTRPVEAE